MNNFLATLKVLPQALAITTGKATSFKFDGKFNVSLTLNSQPHHLTLAEAITVLVSLEMGASASFAVGDINVAISPLA